MPCRLWAWRLPPRAAAQRRKRLRAQAKSKGVKLSAQPLQLAGWTLLVSNAPSALMSGAEALVLYRARWQIELLFKLWKSVGEIDGGAGFRSQNPYRILCEIYAKLIGQIVAHWVILSPARGRTKRAACIRWCKQFRSSVCVWPADWGALAPYNAS